MSMRLSFFLTAGLPVFLLSACAFCVDGPQPVEDVYKVLLDKSVPFDVNKTRKATVESLVKAVDPHAILLTAEEYHEFLMMKSVAKSEEWPEGICYLKLRGIYRDAADEVVGLIRKWSEAGKTGVILDLRSASGESLASVDRIAELYVSGDPFLYQIKDRQGNVIKTHRLKGITATLGSNMPLMLIVNEATTEASEILVALLKNRRGVLIVGSHTSGDASFRENIPLSQDEILRIATRLVVINGPQFESTGVLPDVTIAAVSGRDTPKIPEKGITIKPESEKAKLDRELMKKVYSDPALLRTTDILLGLKATVFYGNETATNTPGSAEIR
ncbi:MAG: S41 family peptidase [Kiritimatiellae bacterium]|nr:S41 family peptidase [Kiritimatiellia bacterium]